MKKLTLLGGISPTTFLQYYWHKKPLLVRQAIPGGGLFLNRKDLFDMAKRDDIESRLITHVKNTWQITHGPLSKLPPLKQKEWTILVQGVNLYNDHADALLRQFRFIPDARLDDLMVSYASDGGGVGPHFDSYDVFLLQTHGQRRWRISAQKDLTLVEGIPLKILKNFKPEQEFTLDPGDMLYLPPHYAHDGVAIGECMTSSVGFRAPVFQELGEAFLQFMADSIELPGRYTDPELCATSRPAELPSTMIDKINTELRKIKFTDDDINIFLGQYLSEPKANVFFTPIERMMTPTRFIQSIKKRGVTLSGKTQMLYKNNYIFINGESFIALSHDKKPLHILANHRKLNPNDLLDASQDVLEALYTWYQNGWILLP